jgi:hypothetical protein
MSRQKPGKDMHLNLHCCVKNGSFRAACPEKAVFCRVLSKSQSRRQKAQLFNPKSGSKKNMPTTMRIIGRPSNDTPTVLMIAPFNILSPNILHSAFTIHIPFIPSDFSPIPYNNFIIGLPFPEHIMD